MKKFVALFWAVAVLSVLPISSFASQPLVFWHQGDIEGLNFYFGSPGLPINLTEIGIDKFKAVSADIETSGNEVAVIFPDTKDYYYYGEYGSGTIIAQSKKGYLIEIPVVSATLVEHFIIEGPIKDAIASPFTVEAPATTSLIFRAVLGSGSNTVRFALVVQNGEIIFAGTY